MTVSYSACTPTGFYRDGIDLTAAQIGGNVTGTLDATGCNIGVYYKPGTTGTVNAADISGANYYGVVADAAAVDVTGSSIHDIGERPFNGTQHGVAVFYTTINQNGGSTGASATGTVSRNTISNYQKNGIVVSGDGAAVTVDSNTVTGLGMIDFIAQNGIQISCLLHPAPRRRLQGLGGDYFARRADPQRQTRRLIAQLERLGHTVTLQEAAAA